MRGLARTMALALCLAGCGRVVGLLGVGARTVAAMASPVRRLPARITHPAREDARLAVLWVGHATVLVQMDDRFVLTDPVFTSAVGQVSPRLVEPGIDPANLPRLDAVLVSHAHFDHLSQGSIAMLAPRAAQVLVPPGVLVYVPDVAVPAMELPAWTSWERDGLRVTAVPVAHDGGRYGADAAWMADGVTGYVIEHRGLTVYFGGDTAYASRLFRATAARFPRIDVAVLPIAPMTPRAARRRHMNPADAVAAMRDLGARVMVPMHFDTFINSADRVGDAPAALRRAVTEAGVDPARVCLLAIGEQRVIVPRGGGRALRCPHGARAAYGLGFRALARHPRQ